MLVGGIWVVIQLTGREPRGQHGQASINEILLTGDSRQTSLEGLAAQLDSARRENAQMRADMARLEGQMSKTIAGVRAAFERELAGDRNRTEAQRARERQRLDRELAGLQGELGDLAADGSPAPRSVDPADPAPAPGPSTAADQDQERTAPAAPRTPQRRCGPTRTAR